MVCFGVSDCHRGFVVSPRSEVYLLCRTDPVPVRLLPSAGFSGPHSALKFHSPWLMRALAGLDYESRCQVHLLHGPQMTKALSSPIK